MVASWVETAEFETLFDDVIVLMDDLRDYIRESRDRESLGLDRDQRLNVTYVVSRMTILMTSAMAWLLLNRAAHNGEVDVTTLAEEGLELQAVIERDRPVIEKPLPSHSPVCDLVERGQEQLDKLAVLLGKVSSAATN